jgi:hypothetical protein
LVPFSIRVQPAYTVRASEFIIPASTCRLLNAGFRAGNAVVRGLPEQGSSQTTSVSAEDGLHLGEQVIYPDG